VPESLGLRFFPYGCIGNVPLNDVKCWQMSAVEQTVLDKSEHNDILALMKFSFWQMPMTLEMMVKSQTGA